MMVYLEGRKGFAAIEASPASPASPAFSSVVSGAARLSEVSGGPPTSPSHSAAPFGPLCAFLLLRRAAVASNLAFDAAVEATMNCLMTATLRSRLYSWMGFKKVVLPSGRRMVALRSLTALNPAGTAPGAAGVAATLAMVRRGRNDVRSDQQLWMLNGSLCIHLLQLCLTVQSMFS